MSKLAVASVVGGGSLVFSSLVGAYALGAFGGGSGTENFSERFRYSPITATQLYEWDGDECNYFKNGLSNLNAKGDVDAQKSNFQANENTFFKDQPENWENLKSCLIVNWDKKSYKLSDTEQKWSGNLTFLWSLLKGKKGLMSFTLIEAKDSKLLFSGSTYALEQKSIGEKGEEKWTVVGVNTKDNQELKGTDVNSKFPQSFAVHTGIGPRWNFLTEQDKYDNILKSGDNATSPKATSFRSIWQFKPDPSNSPANTPDIASWSPNLVSWFDLLYNASSINVPSLIVSVVGQWENKLLEGDPTPNLVAPVKTK